MSDAQLFLIDAHALCYRAFYAIKGLTTSRGQPTNAVYGFVNTLRKIIREYRPTYLAVCFDTPAQTHREKKFAQYKIHRPVMPDDLISQIPYIKKIVRAYGMAMFEKEGYEADDLIATIVSNVAGDPVGVVIVSDDKDIYQLAGAKVKVYHSRKDKILGREEIQEMLGVDPAAIPDFIGLAGDATDNIPGVKGIGKVSAQKLIRQHGHLETLYDRLEDLSSSSLRERLRAQRSEAFLSKDLAVLDDHVPVDVDLTGMKVGTPDAKKLLEIFNDLEFRRLADDMAMEVSGQDDVSVEAIRTREALAPVLSRARKEQTLFFMTDDPAPGEGTTPEGWSFVLDGDDRVYAVGRELAAPVLEALRDPGLKKVTYDMKTEQKRALEHGGDIRGRGFDVMLAAYLLTPSGMSYDMGSLSWRYRNVPMAPESTVPQRAAALRALYETLTKELEEKELQALFEEIEMPLAHVLARMEKEGVRLDTAFLKKLSDECAAGIERLMKDLYEMAGETFNLNSPKQLSQILFVKLKLPVVKKTKTGFSTDEEVLRQLSARHALPAAILEYRQLAKLKSTYIDALPRLVDPATGKIHAAFNQTGTETGRLSSSNPNLQNIPIRTDIGREIRRAFVPSEPGHWMVSADYSQIELRILAHLSGDDNLIAAFKKGQDIHQYTAALVYDVAESDVTPQMRTTAKRVNFGIIYGMSPFGLAKDLDIPLAEAEDFIDKYFIRYPKVRRFMEASVRQCEEQGYVLTLLKRRRYIPEISSPNLSVRQFAQRQAINTPVQGSAADLMKLAMIRIQEELDRRRTGARMLITVHDELVFDVPPEELDDLIPLVRRCMEDSLTLTVPIRVAVKKGRNWLEMEEVGD